MKLSDIKGKEAINTASELLEPFAIISTSEGITEARKKLVEEMNKAKAEKDFEKSNRQKMLAKVHFAQNLLTACPEQIIEVFAILDRTPVEEYEFSLANLPQKIVELISDPYIMQLFGLQSQTETSSGSATESTEVKEN